jgi:hypothetical protein
MYDVNYEAEIALCNVNQLHLQLNSDKFEHSRSTRAHKFKLRNIQLVRVNTKPEIYFM